MQRKQWFIGALLSASLSLGGCGQALVLPGSNSAAQGVGTATPGFEQPVAASAPADSAAPVDSVTSPSAARDATNASPSVLEPSVASSVSPPPSSPPIVAEPSVAPTVNPEFSSAQLPGTQDRWRYIQVDRTPINPIQTYNTPSKQILWWYDPIFGRNIKLGEIQGDFPVQATFRFRGQEVEGLEVPYQLNQSFGIKLPQAIVDQMKQAGSGEWLETFVYKTDDIRPK